MFERHGPPASRRLFVWFVATTIVPAICLGWLGWKMAGQDLALQRTRLNDVRDQAVELAATALQRTVAELEERLATASAATAPPAGVVPDGAALVVFGPDGVVRRAGSLLPYYPALPPTTEIPPDVFGRADELESQKDDSAGAIRVLKGLIASTEPTTRAWALLRIARNYGKLGDLPRAVAAFDSLSGLDATRVGGWPAGLRAHQGRALLFADAGRRDDLAREATLMYSGLQGGHWMLTYSQYAFSSDQARSWLAGPAPQVQDPDALALAAAAEAIWNDWRTPGRQDIFKGRQTLWSGDRSVLVLTRGSPDRLDVLLTGPEFLQRTWRERLRSTGGNQQMEFALSDGDGRAVLGQLSAPLSDQSVRSPSVTRLPWTVHAISTGAGGGPITLSGPARLMLAGIAIMAIVVVFGGYFINRAIAREIKVARLQSEFVAAVSHEFRTPLTTLRHLSELLVQDRVSNNARRREFYDTLLRESQRLHRLVEGLLNFARLESGQLEYRFDTFDANVFLRNLVTEFQHEVSSLGYHVEFQGDVDAPLLRADPELLARVFWNLLDNAVKYSPDARTVRVGLAGSANRLVVRVRDEGIGIPAAEQRDIFRKFVRGAAANARTIKGTGIGLAIAREIVHAHGGELTVESEVGRGSTFSVMLPATEAAELQSPREAGTMSAESPSWADGRGPGA